VSRTETNNGNHQQSAVEATRHTFTTQDKIEVSTVDLDAEVVIIDGLRHTEADAAADGVPIAARYRGLRQGGRSMSADDEHSPAISVVLLRDVRDKLKTRATAEGVSMSKWLRTLAIDQLAS
jgi:predicted alpha/beta-hydrolase family hydrolase